MLPLPPLPVSPPPLMAPPSAICCEAAASASAATAPATSMTSIEPCSTSGATCPPYATLEDDPNPSPDPCRATLEAADAALLASPQRSPPVEKALVVPHAPMASDVSRAPQPPPHADAASASTSAAATYATNAPHSLYCASLLPDTRQRDQGTDWRLGRWTAAADALLASLVRVHHFRFDDVAAELRAHVRGAGRLQHEVARLDWSPSVRLITAEQCRLRWAEIDRALCLNVYIRRA